MSKQELSAARVRELVDEYEAAKEASGPDWPSQYREALATGELRDELLRHALAIADALDELELLRRYRAIPHHEPGRDCERELGELEREIAEFLALRARRSDGGEG